MGTVSTVRLTEGASMSRHKRMKISMSKTKKTIFTDQY